jgi:hypothetical protein
MEFFGNEKNTRKISTKMLRKRDSNAAPFPGPVLLLGECRSRLKNGQPVPK